MIKYLTLLLFLSFTWGQVFDPKTGDLIIERDFAKDSIYLKDKKNLLTAGMLSLFLNVTGSGHLYAGNLDSKIWLRTLPYSTVLLLIINLFPDSDDAPGALQLLYACAYFGLVFDSVKIAHLTNIRLHNKIYNSNIKTIPRLKRFESRLKSKTKYSKNN